LDLARRQRLGIDQLPPGEPHRALVHERKEKQHEDASREEPYAAKHQRLNHLRLSGKAQFATRNATVNVSASALTMNA
jgi:hypothetical protein